MGADAFIEYLKNSLEFVRVEGTPNAYWIRVRKPLAPAREMTDEDWDKFEKDIADAFETVP